MDKRRHLPVNWTNGVKLDQDHFFENYFSRIEMLQAYASMSMSNLNYGILDKPDEHQDALKLDIENNTEGTLHIKLDSCHAITEAGHLINYTKKYYGEAHAPTATLNVEDLDEGNSSQRFLVVVTTDPFNMLPVGEPDPDGTPLHHPYSLPSVRLDIMPESQANTSFFKTYSIIVGEVVREDNVLTFDRTYIPPVRKVMYNETLSAFRKELIASLKNIKAHSLQVFKKNKDSNKINILTENTFILCDDLNQFYSDQIFWLENIAPHEAPIFLFQKFSILANSISMSLNTMMEKDYEILLQYYYEWSDIKPSQLTQSMGNVLNIQYNHARILKSIETVKSFIVMLEELFKKLSDLEYIGLRKENIVISDDSATEGKSKDESAWSLVD